MTGGMALRLDQNATRPSTATGGPGATPTPPAETPADRREAPYRALRAAIEARLDAATTATRRALPGLYLEIAREALDGLAAEPCEPVLLNYAGVALSELGARKGAAQLFQAALRLDPQLADAARNLDRARTRQGAGPKLPAAVAARLRPLENEARRVATAARPATGLRLSLCMIVRDEEEMLPRSLGAARDAVDEIVVVDTGSRDRTVEIARSFGATVIERQWTGSFADARNASIEAATGDWLLFLDADEVLDPADAPLLRELTGRTWREAFYLVETNHTGELGDGTAVTHNALRAFRNRAEYRFEGRVHEQIAQNLPSDLPERIEPTPIRIDHYGYLGAVRDAREKSRRNIELLRRQLGEAGANPFFHFNLGSELAAAGDAAGACEQFERAWALLAEDPTRRERPFTPSLTVRATKALRFNGRLAAAEARALEGLALFPDLTDLVFERALVAAAEGDVERGATLLEECLERGDAPSRYSPTVGSGSFLALVRLAELERPRDPERAEELLRRCLEEHPAYLGSVLPLAAAMIARGVPAEEVVAEIEGAVAAPTPSVRFMLATALYEAGEAAAAEPLYAAVVEAQPGNGGARLALTETLLSTRRYLEAAAVAASIADDDAFAIAAARSELFARVLAGRGDDEGAESATARPGVDDVTAAGAGAPDADATARAARRGLPASELDLFAAWAARTPAFPALDPTIVDTLATMLEALLRVEEFEAFEALLPALAATGLPARRRHSILAEIYLRRGFLESAADEWAASCEEEGPDPEALGGLARVAAARGLTEDAEIFEKGAEELLSSSN
ncbi:MAG: glycosyltransferase family 2 protein [Actinobacteria bacterium]|nr:glycosyltransferase family 2 protein [Actinomycetota bacterium]